MIVSFYHHPHAFIEVPENFQYIIISTAWNYKIPINISLLRWMICFSFSFKISAYFKIMTTHLRYAFRIWSEKLLIKFHWLNKQCWKGLRLADTEELCWSKKFNSLLIKCYIVILFVVKINWLYFLHPDNMLNIFKPGACRPVLSVHLVSWNHFHVDMLIFSSD